MPIHIVDLSHRLQPGRQRFRLEVKTLPVSRVIPEYAGPPGEWYIMQELVMSTHVGTHVEAPLHAIRDGSSAADIDCQRLVGPASIVDFSDKGPNEPITEQEMAERAGHVERDDIVLIRTGLSRVYGTPAYRRPFLETAAVDWLIGRGMKCFGVDCSGFENRQIEGEVNHRRLMECGIPIMEDLNNLDRLHSRRVFFIALPLRIDGTDASPIRPIAIEPWEAGLQLAQVFGSPTSTWEGF